MNWPELYALTVFVGNKWSLFIIPGGSGQIISQMMRSSMKNNEAGVKEKPSLYGILFF